MVYHPVFEWHSKTEPFHNQTHFEHLKTGHVRFLDLHCTYIHVNCQGFHEQILSHKVLSEQKTVEKHWCRTAIRSSTEDLRVNTFSIQEKWDSYLSINSGNLNTELVFQMVQNSSFLEWFVIQAMSWFPNSLLVEMVKSLVTKWHLLTISVSVTQQYPVNHTYNMFADRLVWTIRLATIWILKK